MQVCPHQNGFSPTFFDTILRGSQMAQHKINPHHLTITRNIIYKKNNFAHSLCLVMPSEQNFPELNAPWLLTAQASP